MGVKIEVKIEQGVLWYALKLISFAYSTPRLVCLIFRLVNSERSRYLSIIVLELEVAEIKVKI
jgi:hypothetical protein